MRRRKRESAPPAASAAADWIKPYRDFAAFCLSHLRVVCSGTVRVRAAKLGQGKRGTEKMPQLWVSPVLAACREAAYAEHGNVAEQTPATRAQNNGTTRYLPPWQTRTKRAYAPLFPGRLLLREDSSIR